MFLIKNNELYFRESKIWGHVTSICPFVDEFRSYVQIVGSVHDLLCSLAGVGGYTAADGLLGREPLGCQVCGLHKVEKVVRFNIIF